MIPESFKQDLLNRVDIVDVVSRYVQLKKGGANFMGLCPFHTEKSPSFTVSPAKQFYHCFGCGQHGNAIGFLMAYAGMGYVDAVKDLAAGAGLTVPEDTSRQRPKEERDREQDLYALMERAMEFYRAELKKSDKAIAYLKGRGLSGEIAARFRIGYAPDDWQGLKGAFADYDNRALVDAGLVIATEGKRYDRFRDRVMFPILNARGATIGFGGRVMGEGEPKYLNSPETALFEKGRELYGLVQAREAMRNSSRVLVVEGYMDVVALAQFGVGNAVATLGTATTPTHVGKLLRLAEEIVFCFDGDAAGRKAAWRALEVSLPLALDHKPLRFLFLPEGDDPDSYVRNHGKEAFERLAGESQTLSGFLLGELRADNDLATPEGRSRFLAAAKPHLEKIAAKGFRLQLVKEVAQLAHVSQDEAEQLLGMRSTSTYKHPAPARVQASPPPSLESKLLRVLLIQPKLTAELDLELFDQNLPEGRAVAALAVRCRISESGESLTQAGLIEAFANSPHAESLNRARASLLEIEMSEEVAAQEFRQIHIQRRIERIDQELPRLSGVELARRLQEQAELKNQRA
ncbi:MAG: DNA primase [Betaproteobacteria bacterium]|nr:DNA primase [Betaproteobacteria bacterium]